MRSARLALTVALAGTLAAPATAAERVRPPGSDRPLGNERLSNETTITRWAHADRRAPVRRHARSTSGRIARLRFHTEDGPPEVYLVLRSAVDARGRVWIKVRLPMRPNGRRGWVPREALGAFHVVRTHLRINRSTLTATLYRRGRRTWQARVGIGKPGTPTPAGRFWVREKLRVRERNSLYGPWAIGTSAYSVLSDWPGGGVVGIHGTNQPHLIPGRPSHGCVRVRNAAIRRLVELMPIGTPVRIL